MLVQWGAGVIQSRRSAKQQVSTMYCGPHLVDNNGGVCSNYHGQKICEGRSRAGEGCPGLGGKRPEEYLVRVSLVHSLEYGPVASTHAEAHLLSGDPSPWLHSHEHFPDAKQAIQRQTQTQKTNTNTNTRNKNTRNYQSKWHETYSVKGGLTRCQRKRRRSSFHLPRPV